MEWFSICRLEIPWGDIFLRIYLFIRLNKSSGSDLYVLFFKDICSDFGINTCQNHLEECLISCFVILCYLNHKCDHMVVPNTFFERE